MSSSQPQMSFAQTYILASKVRSKLTREAQSPKSSLRNLVVQANMLDNIMDYISDETKRRTSEKLTSKTNTQKSSSGYLSPESSVVQFAPTPVRQAYKTSITEYEIDSDSSDDDEEEEEDDEDDNEGDYFYEDGQNDYDDLDDYEDSVVMEQDELAAIKGVYYEEDQDEEDEEDEEDNLSETSSIYSNSSDSDLDSDSDEYYIYSDSDEIIEENNIAIEATIPRNFKSLSIAPPPSSTTSSTTSTTQSPLPSIVRSNSTPITITSLHTIDEQQEIEEEKQPELLLHENNQTIDWKLKNHNHLQSLYKNQNISLDQFF
ncbi:Late-stage biofilm-induced protein [Candida albicans P75010]|nr:Late-stage biofilm-induced protein [Candida albicans P75010]